MATRKEKEAILSALSIKGYYEKELPSIKWNGKEGTALCPFHEDKKPSLSVNPETGLFYCHGCEATGNLFDFHMKKHNLSFKDAVKELADFAGISTAQKRKIVTTYNYTDETGKLLFQAVRYQPKDFNQRRPDGNGGWTWDLDGVEPVLYNLPEVIKAETVFIVEGEKDVEALRKLNIVATTNPMGAGKWKAEYNKYLTGKKIIIIPDNDDPGRKHAENVAESLIGIAKTIRIANLPDLPEKGDVTDFLKDHSKEELLAVVDCIDFRKGEEKKSLWDSIPTGTDLQNMDIEVEWVVEGLIPKGSITTLTGRAGVGKSTFLMGLLEAVNKGEPFLGLQTIQMPTLYVDFENPLAVDIDHIRKMNLINTKFWHRALTPRPPKLDDQDWKQYLDLPPCLIVIDSLRAAQSQDQNFSKDMAITLDRCKELRDHGHTVILILHTLKSNEAMFSGSQTQEDQADHPLYMYPVTDTKDGKPTEVDRTEELNEKTFFLGTTYKSRYPTSSHLYLKRAGDGKFVTVRDPKIEKIVKIWEICHKKEGMNKGAIVELVKKETGWSKEQIRRLLSDDKAKDYWVITDGKKNNEKVFGFSVSVPYKGTENQKTKSNGFSASNGKKEGDSSPQAANTGFAGYSGCNIETEKPDDITDPDFIPETDDPDTNGWEA